MKRRHTGEPSTSVAKRPACAAPRRAAPRRAGAALAAGAAKRERCRGRGQADAAALRDASAFRESLPKGICRCRNGWKVRIQVDGKSIFGGRFRPQDDTPGEIERARLAAIECRRRLEQEHLHAQTKEDAGLGEDAALTAKAPQQGKHIRTVQAKRSGVTGVSWEKSNNCWQAQWSEGGKRMFKRFRVHWYMAASGSSYEQADAEALRDAVAFRKSMIRDRTIPAHPEGERGVIWRNGGWMALLYLHGNIIQGGHFRAKDDTPEEIERARLAAVECRHQLELKHFHVEKETTDSSERGKKRQSGVKGVCWLPLRLAWRSSMRKRGQRTSKTFKPTDLSEESIEAARLLAVQHHGDLERCFLDTSEASSSAVPQPAPMDATPPTKGSQRGKRVVRVQAKRSGVRGITWHSGMNCWQIRWCEGAKRKRRAFYVHRYTDSSGKGYQEADAKALRDAIAFRKSLVKDGVVKAVRASRQAGRRGVQWRTGAWRAIINVEGKRISGGTFRPQDDTPEEIERTRLAAVERQRQLELEHFQIQRKEAVDPSEMQKMRESGVAGVTWDCHGLA